MPTYRYQAYDQQGRLAAGVTDAASEKAASDQLWGQGLTVFKLSRETQQAQEWWRRDLFTRQGPSQDDVTCFVRELATFMTASIPLDDALRIIGEQTASTKVSGLSNQLLAQVIDGAMLSEALERQLGGSYLEHINMVRAGELGGRLGDVLSELADLLERRAEVRSRIRSALVYPIMLIMLSVGSIAIIVAVLVPSIAAIFVGSGKPPPNLIRFSLLIYEHASTIAIVASSFVAILAGVTISALKKPVVRNIVDRQTLSLPVLGPFMIQQLTARFTRTLGTLLKAGVPLVQAASSANSVISNAHMASCIGRAIDSIRGGLKLHQALRRETTLSPIALRMISVGEESGRLEQMLLRVSDMLERQTERRIERLMTILTPLLTISIAVLVGGIIMTAMNAIMSVNDLALK